MGTTVTCDFIPGMGHLPEAAGDFESEVSEMGCDQLHAHACARYLELASMVKRLAGMYGLPMEVVWYDVVSGYDVL